MTEGNYDELAHILREYAERLGDTAFTDRRRLMSLLADRIPDSRREIRVVGAAVDERVFDTLARTRPQQVGMEVDRLAARLESGLGIRSDIALEVVKACAFGLGIGPLPSSTGAGGPHAAPLPGHTAQDDTWIGVSEPAARPWAAPAAVASPPVAAADVASPPAAPRRFRIGRILLWSGNIVLACLVALYVIGINLPDEQRSGPAPNPQPSPGPVIPGPVTPGPVTPGPVRSDPAPPRPSPPNPPGTQAYNELIDFGVPPQSTLQSNVGSPTPTTIPGGRLVTTTAIQEEQRKQSTFLLIDSLADAHGRTIPGATYLPNAGNFGTFNDAAQQALRSDLSRLTRGQQGYPLVFFCQGVRCWESYNAALRAIAAGYTSVFWYRGGIEAWAAANLSMQPTPQR